MAARRLSLVLVRLCMLHTGQLALSLVDCNRCSGRPAAGAHCKAGSHDTWLRQQGLLAAPLYVSALYVSNPQAADELQCNCKDFVSHCDASDDPIAQRQGSQSIIRQA